MLKYATKSLESLLRRARWQGRAAWAMAEGRLRRLIHPAASPGTQLVVCGYPRGGTSLVYNMLSSSLDGFRFAPFEVPARRTITCCGNRASKLPLDVLRLDELVRQNVLGKRLAVIVMLRDPRDLITSVHPNVPDRYFLDYDGSWTPHRTGPRRTPHGIRAIHEAIERARTIEGIDLVEIRYEDLVAEPDAVQARLSDALGLEFRQRFSDFHRRGARHAYRYAGRMAAKDQSLVRENAPVDRSRAGKWRRPEHADRIAEQFAKHPALYDLLEACGYTPHKSMPEPPKTSRGVHPRATDLVCVPRGHARG